MMLYIMLAIGIAFAYIDGVHDGSTIIATTISSRLLPPRQAIFLAGISNFAGAIVMGTAVAMTVARGLVDSDKIIAGGADSACTLIIAAFAASIVWNVATWITKLPSSASHSMLGALLGSTLAAFGSGAVYWDNFMIKVVAAMLISPIMGFIIGYLILHLEQAMLRNATMIWKGRISLLHKISTILLAFSYGSNDSQKVMGLLAIGIAASSASSISVPLWLAVSCSLALAIGTMTGGRNMVYTVGKNITKIDLDNSFSSQLASILVVATANVTGIPISATQVVTASVMGVGTEVTPKGVNWSAARNILIAWIVTIPASALLGGLAYELIAIAI